MTKTEQTRLKTWRLKVLQHAGERSRNVARTCRHFGISCVLLCLAYFFFALALISSRVGARAASKSANGSKVIVTIWL